MPGIPLLEKNRWFVGFGFWFLAPWFLVSKILGFLVSKILRYLVSEFIGFLVSKFLGFKVSKLYQISISCFLEDIDRISKFLKKLLDRSSGFVGARLFPKLQFVDFPNFRDS